ncbi:MAG: hypothetical protein ACO1RT_17580 [Planctomycetaceae bacterium]
MSATARVTTSTVINGVTITSVVDRSEESSERMSLSLPAGIEGTLSTRTNDTAGILTVNEGHGVTDADTIAVFFDDGVAYNCNVSAATATTITFDSAEGTVLPAADSEIIASVQASYALLLDGDSLRVFAIFCTYRAWIDFRTSAPASVLVYDIAAREGRIYVSDVDAINPLASDDVATVHVANGSTTATTLEIGMLKAA